MSKTQRIKGVLAPVVTPFKADLSPDGELLATGEMDDEMIRQAMQTMALMFRDHAPTTAARAATIILDGVRAEAGVWRGVAPADLLFAHRTEAAAILALSSALAACANQAPKPDGRFGPGGPGGVGRDGGPVTPGSARDFSVNVGDIVYFTTDSWDLTPDAQQTLRNQATWLNQYPQFTILLEGHADERGTREYNIALGARRAVAVRDFLARNGISSQRIRHVSYGKERPVAVCNDISCWSQNRRAQTVLNNRTAQAGR